MDSEIKMSSGTYQSSFEKKANCSSSSAVDSCGAQAEKAKKRQQKPKTAKNSAHKLPTDRFIPTRKSSKLNLVFTSAHNYPTSSERSKTVQSVRQSTQSAVKILPLMDSPSLTLSELYKAEILKMNPPQIENTFNPFSNNNLFKYKENITPADSAYGLEAGMSLKVKEELFSYFIRNTRKINKVPFKVLDAPALQDDFYLNLIDWSSQNILAVGLGSCVYLWSAATSKVTKLCDLGPADNVTSVIWSPKNNYMGIGTNSGEVQVWDTVKVKKTRVLSGHSARVGAMAWCSNYLTTGSRDKNILVRDLRVIQNYVSKHVGHKQEICGLKWSFDEQQLASGGNDNKLLVWNLASTTPLMKFNKHTAAVKALAWSPHQHGLLASGGGTADRTIRFWNTLNNSQLDFIDTGSQVCNLMFSRNVNELVSTHGYSLNQIVLWKYPTMEKITTLTGHTFRVLYLAMSPDGQTIVTGAGDETLRFWNVFPPRGDKGRDAWEESCLISSNSDLR